MFAELIRNLTLWSVVGFLGQIVFMGRFVVQWIASERSGRSVVPVAFWYLSILGSLILLTYALVRADPVFVVGQALGSVIYVRNLMLIRRTRRPEQATGPLKTESL